MRPTLLLLTLAALFSSNAFAADLVVSNPGDAGEDTLRAALQIANETAGTDTISFQCPEGGTLAIEPESPLPPITDLLVLHGDCAILDGARAGNADGLEVRAPSTIRGLVVRNFTSFGRAGIALVEHEGSVVSSATLTGNDWGLRILGGGRHRIGSTSIGGTTAQEANLSGGVLSEASSLNQIGMEQCLILCSEPHGEIVIRGNAGPGIVLQGDFNWIRGQISSNAGDGIRISGEANRIAANITDNAGVGVFERGTTDFIQGTLAGNAAGGSATFDFPPSLDINSIKSYPLAGSPGRTAFEMKGVLQGVAGRLYRLDFWAAQSCAGTSPDRSKMQATRFLLTPPNGTLAFDVTVATSTFSQTPALAVSAGLGWQDPSGLPFQIADSFDALVCAMPDVQPKPLSYDIQVSMEAPSSARAAEPFAVPIRIRNASAAPSSRVELRVQAHPTGRVLAIEMPTEVYLAAGQETATLEIPAESTIDAVAIVSFPATGQAVVTATATLQGAQEVNALDNSAEATIAIGTAPANPALVRSTLTPAPNPQVSLARRYVVKVENTGGANAGPVYIPLPGTSLQLLAISVEGARCGEGGCIVPLLAPGESVEGIILAYPGQRGRRRLVGR